MPKGLLRFACALGLGLAFAAPDALAHKIRCFARVEGDRVVGRAYATGGGAIKDRPVEVYGAGGRLLHRTRTDEKGKFAFVPPAREDLRIVVKAGPGHEAEYTVCGADLPPEPVASPAQETAPGARDLGAIRALVGQAVDEKIQPLREDLDRIRLRDVIGGLGYILGLTGLAFYLSARARLARAGADRRERAAT